MKNICLVITNIKNFLQSDVEQYVLVIRLWRRTVIPVLWRVSWSSIRTASPSAPWSLLLQHWTPETSVHHHQLPDSTEPVSTCPSPLTTCLHLSTMRRVRGILTTAWIRVSTNKWLTTNLTMMTPSPGQRLESRLKWITSRLHFYH